MILFIKYSLINIFLKIPDTEKVLRIGQVLGMFQTYLILTVPFIR